MSPIKAVLFDFNGLIVDDEPIHYELFFQVLRDENIDLTEEKYWNDYLGFDDKGLFEAIYKDKGEHLTPKKLKTLIQKKNELYFPTLKKKLKLFPGVVDFIQFTSGKVPICVVSGALRSEIEFVLNESNLSSYFQFIVSADDTKRGKPDPEGFVMAYTRLKKTYPDLLPENCLVVEDSLAGIEAAQRALMPVAALPHTYAKEKLSSANYVVNSFEELKKLF